MRCRACDAILQDYEIYVNKSTGQFEELCGVCRGYAFAAALGLDDEEGDIEELGEFAKEWDEWD